MKKALKTTLIISTLLIMSCTKEVKEPCKIITGKYKRIKYIRLENGSFQKRYHYYVVLDNKDTIGVGTYQYEWKNIGDCFKIK